MQEPISTYCTYIHKYTVWCYVSHPFQTNPEYTCRLTTSTGRLMAVSLEPKPQGQLSLSFPFSVSGMCLCVHYMQRVQSCIYMYIHMPSIQYGMNACVNTELASARLFLTDIQFSPLPFCMSHFARTHDSFVYINIPNYNYNIFKLVISCWLQMSMKHTHSECCHTLESIQQKTQGRVIEIYLPCRDEERTKNIAHKTEKKKLKIARKWCCVWNTCRHVRKGYRILLYFLTQNVERAKSCLHMRIS